MTYRNFKGFAVGQVWNCQTDSSKLVRRQTHWNSCRLLIIFCSIVNNNSASSLWGYCCGCLNLMLQLHAHQHRLDPLIRWICLALLDILLLSLEVGLPCNCLHVVAMCSMLSESMNRHALRRRYCSWLPHCLVNLWQDMVPSMKFRFWTLGRIVPYMVVYHI